MFCINMSRLCEGAEKPQKSKQNKKACKDGENMYGPEPTGSLSGKPAYDGVTFPVWQPADRLSEIRRETTTNGYIYFV